MLPTLESGWDILIDGLHCQRYGIHIAPLLRELIFVSANRHGRINEVNNLLTANCTSILHFLYKDNVADKDIASVTGAPSYKCASYTVHAFEVDGSHINTVDPRRPIPQDVFNVRYTPLAQALDVIVKSQVSHILTHAIDVIAIAKTAERFLGTSSDFPGSLIICSCEDVFIQIEHILCRAAEHWMELLALTDPTPLVDASTHGFGQVTSRTMSRAARYVGRSLALRCYDTTTLDPASWQHRTAALRGKLKQSEVSINAALGGLTSLNVYDFAVTNCFGELRYSKYRGGAGAGQAQ